MAAFGLTFKQLFWLCSALGWLAVVVLGARFRNWQYARFRGVILLIYGLIAGAMAPRLALFHVAAGPVLLYLHLVVFVQSTALIWPKMRPLPYRLLVSMPEAFMLAGTLLAFPWALIGAIGFELPLPWLPYATAALGLFGSLGARREEHQLHLDRQEVAALERYRSQGPVMNRPLRVVQITDPHLGPWMSVARLRGICERAVAKKPDIVLLTGDFLTMESQSDPNNLERALSPLKVLPGKVFACFGNHDLEAPDTVKSALAAIAAKLLIDDSCVVDTPAGKLQILGAQFRYRGRREALVQLCDEHKRVPGALRILLLHDPGAFADVPRDDVDVVFSGHTHGGQIGLVSLGLQATLVSLATKIPDHGFWALGRSRLYVHRASGHYGFPIRLGVPAEESLLNLHW